MVETSPTPRRPERTCVGCRRRRPKPELLRIVRTAEGVRFDERQRLPGRGAYVCPGRECLEAAGHRNGRSIQRALRGVQHDQVQRTLDELRAHLDRSAPGDGTYATEPRRPPVDDDGATGAAAGVERHEEQNA